MNINEIRNDFPLLRENAAKKPLIYFDSAATTLKPYSVIEAVRKFYKCPDIHRGTFL